jgi:hypothetical protein
MVDPHPRLSLAAVIVGGLATLRVVLFGFFDQRPHFGGAEANDLGILARNFLPFRAESGLDVQHLLQNIRLEHHQPPLYYVGLPALFSSSESLSFGPMLLTNAAALALALWAAWAFGARLGRPRLGLLSVLLVAALPLVAGRVTILGVEPWHLALIGWTLVLFIRVRETDATAWHGVLLGVLIATGLLMKLTFVAALFGPLLLESVSALTGGASTRKWLVRLLVAGAVAAVLLLVGFLPFTSSLDEFLTMAQTEPTTKSVFSFVAGWTLIRWLGVGLGQAPWGPLVLVLALVGAWVGRTRGAQPSPLGRRAAVLLGASVVSLIAIHWLVPHKEMKYLLPAGWSIGVLLAMGFDPLWDRGRPGRALVVGGLSVMVLSTFVVAKEPQIPTRPAARATMLELEPPALRLWLDRSDYGIGAIVADASFEEFDRPKVLTSLEDPNFTTLRDLIYWELHGRNDRLVVALAEVPSLTSELGRQELVSATHFITNRVLKKDELRILSEPGFIEVARTKLPLPGPREWTLWVRGAEEVVRDDFALDVDEWEVWSDVAPSEPHDYELGLTEVHEGYKGAAGRLQGSWTAADDSGRTGGRTFAMQRVFRRLDRFHLSFDWRAFTTGGRTPDVLLELGDAKDGTVFHRQVLSLDRAPDTGWRTVPPTDFSAHVPEAAPTYVFLRIGLLQAAPGADKNTLLVDNFRLVRRGLDPPAVALLETDDPGASATPWTPWRLSSAQSNGYTMELDADAGAPPPSVHAAGVHKAGGDAPRYGIQRTLPVAMPFVVSMDWLTRSESGEVAPPMTFELLGPDGARLHSWRVDGSPTWSRFAPPDLSHNLIGVPEVIVRVGVVDGDGTARESKLWIDNFSWTPACADPRPHYKDQDQDGYGIPSEPHPYGDLCLTMPGWAPNQTDCDDEDAVIHPGAEEVCSDGIDQDCDGAEAGGGADPDCAWSTSWLTPAAKSKDGPGPTVPAEGLRAAVRALDSLYPRGSTGEVMFRATDGDGASVQHAFPASDRATLVRVVADVLRQNLGTPSSIEISLPPRVAAVRLVDQEWPTPRVVQEQVIAPFVAAVPPTLTAGVDGEWLVWLLERGETSSAASALDTRLVAEAAEQSARLRAWLRVPVSERWIPLPGSVRWTLPSGPHMPVAPEGAGQGVGEAVEIVAFTQALDELGGPPVVKD